MDVIAVTSLLPPLYVLFGGPASEEGVNLKDKKFPLTGNLTNYPNPKPKDISSLTCDNPKIDKSGLFNPIPNDILRSDLVLPV